MSADEELFARIRQAIARGWINVPEGYGYGGTGGAGRILEELLDAQGGNLDTPDAGKWEIKFHTKSALLTLFHKEAEPAGHMHHLVRLFRHRRRQGAQELPPHDQGEVKRRLLRHQRSQSDYCAKRLAQRCDLAILDA